MEEVKRGLYSQRGGILVVVVEAEGVVAPPAATFEWRGHEATDGDSGASPHVGQSACRASGRLAELGLGLLGPFSWPEYSVVWQACSEDPEADTETELNVKRF